MATATAPPMRGGMSSPLDGHPPSGAIDPAAAPAGVLPSSMAGLAAPPIGAGQLPPEVLNGIMARGEQISKDFEAFAQVTPDLAADWSLLRDLFQKTLSKVLMAGASAPSPTAAGTSFPGSSVMQGGAPA